MWDTFHLFLAVFLFVLIFKTLEETGKNKTKAADILGISIRTLRNKLNEYKEKDS